MQRRQFLGRAGIAGLAASSLIPGASAADTPGKISWKLSSSYPKSLDTIYGAAEQLANRVRSLTNGQFDIRVFASGELVPGLQVLDAVKEGTVQCGHSASYYYVGKNKAFAFDTSVPFGLTALQQNAWLYQGGGLALLRELFRSYNVINFPGGNTGTQMGGWFRKEVRSLADLKGLKMRIPGIGGEILSRLGVVPQNIAGGDIYPALEKGTIDATEWVGPYDDEKLGFYKVAQHYYYPGFWEPGPTLSFYVNLAEWAKLPKAYQTAFEVAAAEANLTMLAAYDAKNPPALLRLLQQGVKVKPFPADVVAEAQKQAFALYDEEAARNPSFKKIYTAWLAFRKQEHAWFNLAERAMENAMSAPAKPR